MAHNEYKEERLRNFWFVQKVCNLPDNWREIFENKLIPGCYILHDKDTYTEDDELKEPEHIAGELKDEHVHFFVYFNGKRTASGVRKLFPEFHLGMVEPVPYKNGAIAYMLHLGKTDKHVYSYDELKIVNGLKVNFADVSGVDFGDVMEYCRQNHISRLGKLLKSTEKTNPPIFRYVQSHYALICAFFADERDAKNSDVDFD